jgi:hypothetical protein
MLLVQPARPLGAVFRDLLADGSDQVDAHRFHRAGPRVRVFQTGGMQRGVARFGVGQGCRFPGRSAAARTISVRQKCSSRVGGLW